MSADFHFLKTDKNIISLNFSKMADNLYVAYSLQSFVVFFHRDASALYFMKTFVVFLDDLLLGECYCLSEFFLHSTGVSELDSSSS